MMRLWVAFVLVLMLASSAFAGEYLMNDTGETVTGLRVIFSEPVTITGCGDVLMTVEPRGESTEFLFTGGEVEAWGGHWLNWEPCLATVTEYEWLSGNVKDVSLKPSPKERVTREELLSLGRSPTYKEIMEEIAEYPGPDEPLYEPAEDEAIWLTDLEGHADIYDNDSIKINYADWYDQSQITKTDVYRNGVKMRFLPDRFDVLTNAKMKTFDGNPLEHTPASDHTDHAIFGYEYEFRFVNSVGHILDRWACVIQSPVKYQGKSEINIGILWDALEQLTDAELATKLQEVGNIGFSGVQFSVFYFIESPGANVVIPIYESGTRRTQWWARTLRDDEIRRILRLCEKQGLDVEVRIELWMTEDCKRAYPAASQSNRGGIRPSNVQQWFQSYADVCSHIARIAEEEQGDTLCLAVELLSMSRYTEQWRTLAKQIRKDFHGCITFSEATHCVLVNSRHDLGDYWDAFDTIGIEIWPTCYPLESQYDQRLSVLSERVVSHYVPAIQYYTNTFPGTSIGFDEAGTYNADGAVVEGWSDAIRDFSADELDHQEVADTWAAILLGAECLKLNRVTVWTIVLNQNYDLLAPGSHLITSPGAVGVIRELITDTPSLSTYRLEIPIAARAFVHHAVVGLEFDETSHVRFDCSGDHNWSHSEFWGRSGNQVEKACAMLYSKAVAVQVTLGTPDEFEHYRYIFGFSLPLARFYIFIDTENQAVQVALDSGGRWKVLGYFRGDFIEIEGATVTAVVPLDMISEYVARTSLSTCYYDLHLDYRSDGRRELFLFPGKAPLEAFDNVLAIPE